MILSTDELSCGYNQRAVLKGLQFCLQPGQLTVILGPNGAGKTTLLKTLARLLPPVRGRIRLDNQELAGLPRSALARAISYAPQVQAPDWPFTVREYIELARAPHRGWWRPLTADDHAVVAKAIIDLGIEKLAEVPVTHISGGEWQRTRLAQAIAQQSTWLLLDEPTAHLDPRSTYDLLSAIRRFVAERELGVVMTLHDLNLVGSWADRVLLCADGEIQADGCAAEVLTESHLMRAYGVNLSVANHPVTQTPIIAVTPAATA